MPWTDARQVPGIPVDLFFMIIIEIKCARRSSSLGGRGLILSGMWGRGGVARCQTGRGWEEGRRP